MKLFPKSSSAGYAIDGGPDIPFNKITQSASTTKVVIGGREIFSQGGGGGAVNNLPKKFRTVDNK